MRLNLPRLRPAGFDAVTAAKSLFSGGGAFARYRGPAAILHADGRVAAANGAAWDRVDVLGLAEAAPLRPELAAAIAAGRPETITIATDAGALRLDVMPLERGAGGTALVLGHDIGTSHALNEALIELRARYKALVELSSEFAWETGFRRPLQLRLAAGCVGLWRGRARRADAGVVRPRAARRTRHARAVRHPRKRRWRHRVVAPQGRRRGLPRRFRRADRGARRILAGRARDLPRRDGGPRPRGRAGARAPARRSPRASGANHARCGIGGCDGARSGRGDRAGARAARLPHLSVGAERRYRSRGIDRRHRGRRRARAPRHARRSREYRPCRHGNELRATHRAPDAASSRRERRAAPRTRTRRLRHGRRTTATWSPASPTSSASRWRRPIPRRRWSTRRAPIRSPGCSTAAPSRTRWARGSSAQ